MSLKAYFENTTGTGVLATADSGGSVDMAIYARPHMMDDGSMALIMRDKLSHANLQSNPHAAYLFKEDGPGYRGKRFFLTRLREEQDTDLLYEVKRRCPDPADESDKGPRFLVFFRIDRELPLVGAGGQ